MRKLFHKHVSQRVKRLPRHFTKYLYERDTIFATLWIFIFMIVVGLININFYFFNPLKLALKDFDFNDITYAKLGKSADTKFDERIAVINIGKLDREGLANLIDKTASYNPKAIGLDVMFYGPNEPQLDEDLKNTREFISESENRIRKADSTIQALLPRIAANPALQDSVDQYQAMVFASTMELENAKEEYLREAELWHKARSKDTLLREAFHRHKNLIGVSGLDWTRNKKENLENEGYFGKDLEKQGYANLIGDSKELEERFSIRFYSSYEKEKKRRYTSFGAMLVKEYDSLAYEKLMARKTKQEILNYSRHTNQYYVYQAGKIMEGVDSSLLKGKIVLLGYVSEDPNDLEDKFFTPMNRRFAGKTVPDMNGIIIHANYISMVLDKDYIKTLPSWVNWLVAVLIGWLHMSFFIRYYLESHIWFHLVAKIAQLLSAIFFVYLGMMLYDRFNIKLDMKYTLITIVLAVDIIYFYEAFAVWMHKKFHYHTVFHQKHH